MEEGLQKNAITALIAAAALLVFFNQYSLYMVLHSNLEDSGGIAGALTYNSGQVEFDLYVMSQCPYGVQMEDALKPVMGALRENVKLDINFIASENGGVFSSMHGQQEVEGDIIHLCAKKYYPATYLDFIYCQNKNPRNFKRTINECAAQSNMDAEKIASCSESQEGQELLSASIKEADSAGARGSPTMYINNNPYNGGRDSASLFNAICSAFTQKPKACGEPLGQ